MTKPLPREPHLPVSGQRISAGCDRPVNIDQVWVGSHAGSYPRKRKPVPIAGRKK